MTSGVSGAALPVDERGAVVTLGSFDGVHRGHRKILEEITSRAARTGRRSVLVTFHPHPLRIIRPDAAPKLLTTPAEKKEFLAESGIEYAIFLAFTPELRQYTARRFVEEILLGRLGMRELVIGHDHAFGRGREGNADAMRQLGSELGFEVDVVGEVKIDDAAISSSEIRRALDEGDVISSARALGRPYSLQGRVVVGMMQGRKLGFPTANIQVDDSEKLLPLEGIYAVRGGVRGERLPGLLHLGPRPTFPGYTPTVELHLLDWDGDLYGADVRVEFCSRIRGIERFPSAGELVERMHRDADEARRLFGPAGSAACVEGLR